MDQIRVTKKLAETAIDENFDLVDDSEDAEFATMQSQSLKKSLDQIPSDEKALLLMKYQDDFSIKDISEALNITESAVKMRLLRSKDKLRKIYIDQIALLGLIIIKILVFWRK